MKRTLHVDRLPTAGRWLWLAALAFCTGAASWPLVAATCSVPGSHSKIQGAVDDPACSTIELQAQTYDESVVVARSLTLAGPAGTPATLQGLLRVTGAGTEVQLADLRVENGCAPAALQVRSRARVEGSRVAALRSAALPCPPAPIFTDGFESGNTSAWSSTVGSSTVAAASPLTAPGTPLAKIWRSP